MEAASAHAAADVTACAPAGGGATASTAPSTPPAATGPDGASLGERAADTPLAARDAVPVLSLRCGNTLTPAQVNGFWGSDTTIYPCGSGGGSALSRGGLVRALVGLPAESALFDPLPWCG
ncbi:MAG: hypothetical protein HGA74_08460 [Deltaproteobacteria bacterium]|nr:hypothetical protein [Deltaproteobacteria bacterium]